MQEGPSELTLEQQFNSYHGGISVWIERLGECLIEHGVDELLRSMQEELANTREQRLRNDAHFLIEGLKSINRTELENAIVPLKEPYHQFPLLNDHYEQAFAALRHAEEEWHCAAQKVKHQLDTWGNWTCRTEVERRKKDFGRWATLVNPMFVHFEFFGGSSVLTSPERLAGNSAFFKEKVAAIRAVIARSYVANTLPEDLSPVDFDTAIHALESHQEKVNELSGALDRARDACKQVEEHYASLASPLRRLLWQMPNTAHWALFRICRPELCQLSVA